MILSLTVMLLTIDNNLFGEVIITRLNFSDFCSKFIINSAYILPSSTLKVCVLYADRCTCRDFIGDFLSEKLPHGSDPYEYRK